MDHISVVEELPEAWWGTRYRARCETCPWAMSVGNEDAAYRVAQDHFDQAADRARAAKLLAAAS